MSTISDIRKEARDNGMVLRSEWKLYLNGHKEYGLYHRGTNQVAASPFTIQQLSSIMIEEGFSKFSDESF